jgi:hypothetical protein
MASIKKARKKGTPLTSDNAKWVLIAIEAPISTNRIDNETPGGVSV